MDLATPCAGPAPLAASPASSREAVHGLAVCTGPICGANWAAMPMPSLCYSQIVAIELALTAILESRAAVELLESGAASPAACSLRRPRSLPRYRLGWAATPPSLSRNHVATMRVATSVDLRKFESAPFYDRLQRVQASVLTRPYQITYGLVGTVGAAAASAAGSRCCCIPHCSRC